jgi:hypothetical protein
MKPMLIIAAFSFWSALFGYEAKMRVVDDTGAPVQGANVAIEFVAPRQEQSVIYRGTTEKEGTFSAQGQSMLEVYMEAKKTGHYDARVYGLSPKKDHDLVVVIPRILNPVPLHAWDSRLGRSGRALHFTVQNEWLGYDFEIGDWVSPRGKGKVADIRFRFRNRFKGWKHSDKDMANNRRVNSGASEDEIRGIYGKWDAEMDISFPGEKEGLCEETRFLEYSQLKLPHNAPAEGYVPTWRYTSSSYSPRTARENVGFFLRTRVKLDEKGKIVSANYAKVVGDFQVDARGFVMFGYYFNPVANDRNLEFDPKKNLFPANLPGANVNDP